MSKHVTSGKATQTTDSPKDINERLREMGVRVRSFAEIKEPKKNECWRCGACCCVYPNLPPFTQDEIGALLRDIRSIVKWFRTHRTHGVVSPCPFVERRQGSSCMIYEHRPQVCRDYEPGSQSCLNHRQRAFRLSLSDFAIEALNADAQPHEP